jgi:hypothetical protein
MPDQLVVPVPPEIMVRLVLQDPPEPQEMLVRREALALPETKVQQDQPEQREQLVMQVQQEALV